MRTAWTSRARIAVAQIVEVGFSPNCARQIRDVAYYADGLAVHAAGRRRFDMPLIGEYNVRNAAMAIQRAHFYGVPLEKIREGAGELQGRRAPAGSARRSARHHGDRRLRPSSHGDPRNAARRCGIVIPGAGSGRFSSRARTPPAAPFSSTNCPEALKLADGVFISQVARLDQIPENERLDPEAVMESIAASGRPAFYEPDAAHIIEKLVPLLKAERRRGDLQQRRVRRDSREVAGAVEGLSLSSRGWRSAPRDLASAEALSRSDGQCSVNARR